MEKFIVKAHKSLTNASKVLNARGEPLQDENEPSEWAVAYALLQFDIGQEITIEEFEKALTEGMIQQALSGLVDEGRVEMMWDEKRQDFVYKLKK